MPGSGFVGEPEAVRRWKLRRWPARLLIFARHLALRLFAFACSPSRGGSPPPHSLYSGYLALPTSYAERDGGREEPRFECAVVEGQDDLERGSPSKRAARSDHSDLCTSLPPPARAPPCEAERPRRTSTCARSVSRFSTAFQQQDHRRHRSHHHLNLAGETFVASRSAFTCESMRKRRRRRSRRFESEPLHFELQSPLESSTSIVFSLAAAVRQAERSLSLFRLSSLTLASFTVLARSWRPASRL